MTEQQILEAMHTQAAAQPWAVNVAALADDDEDYTWAGPSYPAVPALAADNARLRGQITDLHSEYSAQIATLELRVEELEHERARTRALLAALLYDNDPRARALLDRWLTSMVQP